MLQVVRVTDAAEKGVREEAGHITGLALHIFSPFSESHFPVCLRIRALVLCWRDINPNYRVMMPR